MEGGGRERAPPTERSRVAQTTGLEFWTECRGLARGARRLHSLIARKHAPDDAKYRLPSRDVATRFGEQL